MIDEPLGVSTLNGDQIEKAYEEVIALLDGFKARAEAATAAAEEANRKANSESAFAYNAKQNAEDHAKAIAQVRGSVDADFNYLTTTKANADTASNDIVVAKKAAESDARLTAESKAAADSDLAALRVSKEKAEAALSITEKARDEATALAKRATEDTAEITKAKANTDTAASAVQATQAQVSDLGAQVQVDAKAVASRNTESQALLASMVEVVETAKASLGRVQTYEEELKRLSVDFEALHNKIEALLPGATSAGLASAFRDQKARFNGPQKTWLTTFILTILALLAVGALGLNGLVNEPITWDSTLRHVVSRLPVAVPLLWLALYAGRNYMLALRLQEDYAYKEAVSTSFEGYRREMASIPVSGDQLGPILTLCENVLRTLGQRPGRLYDGKHDDVTPLTPITKLLKETPLLKVLGGGSSKGAAEEK